MLFDESGDRLSPTHAVKDGRRYRYYVSHRLMAARRKARDGWRLPADEIDHIVSNKLADLLSDEARVVELAQAETSSAKIDVVRTTAARACEVLAHNSAQDVRALLQAILHRVTLHPDGIQLELTRQGLTGWLRGEPCGKQKAGTSDNPTAPLVIRIDATLQRRGVEARFVLNRQAAARRPPDTNLTALIARAHRCLHLLTTGGLESMDAIAKAMSLPASEVSRILPLAFLAPDIVRAILAGDQPVTLTAERLKRLPSLPLDWTAQRGLLGFDGPATA